MNSIAGLFFEVANYTVEFQFVNQHDYFVISMTILFSQKFVLNFIYNYLSIHINKYMVRSSFYNGKIWHMVNFEEYSWCEENLA